MNIPQTLKEHLKENYYVHDVAIIVYFWAMEFDAVEKIVEQEDSEGNVQKVVKQFMGNLPHCEDDIEAFKGAMEQYGITKATNPGNIYELKDPKNMEVMKTMAEIKKRLKANPDKKHLILYVAAGHGMNVNGQQVLLVNQFAESEKFYKFFPVEQEIRTIAKNFMKNSFQLGIFACCREIYRESKHKGQKKGSATASEALAPDETYTEQVPEKKARGGTEVLANMEC